MDAFDQLPRAAFDTITFPVRKVTVRGGIRQHDHEFPKAPGAAPEKLGRKLYTISMSAVFYNNLLPPWDEGLWPGSLSELFDRFEEQLTSDLVIPTVGTIRAFCTNWTKEMDVKARSGETAELEFKEDQASDYLLEGIINVRAQSLLSQGQAIATAASLARVPGPFAALVAQINELTAILDRAELNTGLAQAKVAGVLGSFARLDAQVGALSDPGNYMLLEVFLDAWSQTQTIQGDLLRQSVPLLDYTVPRLMSVTDVSRAIYGDASRATDILGLNPIEDAFAIRPGTVVRAYSPS